MLYQVFHLMLQSVLDVESDYLVFLSCLSMMTNNNNNNNNNNNDNNFKN